MIKNNIVTPKAFYNMINKDGTVIIGLDKIYNLVRRKDFPSLRIGGRYYILVDKVDEWLNKQAEKFWC